MDTTSKKKSTEYVRAFRERQRANKPPKQPPKSSKERCREYRARKKALRNAALAGDSSQGSALPTDDSSQVSQDSSIASSSQKSVEGDSNNGSASLMPPEDLNGRYWKYMGAPEIMKTDVLPRFFACQNESSESQTVDPLETTNDNDNDKSIFVFGPVTEGNDEFILPDHLETVEQKLSSTSSPNCPQTINQSETKKPEIIPKCTEVVPQTQEIATSPMQAKTCNNYSCVREEEGIPIKAEKPPMDSNNVYEKPDDFQILLDPCNSQIKQVEPIKEISGHLETIAMDICEQDVKIDHSEIILDPCNGQIMRNVREDIDQEEKVKETMKKIDKLKKTIYEETTKLLIEDNPLLFLGLPKDHLSLIDELSESSGYTKKCIHLVMMKIRQNITNAVLSSYFGLTETPTFPLTGEQLSTIAKFFSRSIIWPTSNEIRLNLPLQFSERHGRLHSIIDIFDIHAGERNLSLKHADGDSMRKYLISTSPDGVINYLSNGYSSTMSEVQIIKNSEYLNRLPNGVAILADKTYKSVEILVQRKQCILIRPPIVLIDLKSTEREKSTLHINCVREYIQKIVKQLREFKVLVNHACLENDLFTHLDQAVIIAGGLYNLQKRNLS